MVRACYTSQQRIVWIAGFAMGMVLALLGAGLILFQQDWFSGLLALLFGLWLVVCLIGNLRRSSCYTLLDDVLCVGGEAFRLSRVARAGIKNERTCAFSVFEPGLWLELDYGRRVWLSTFPEGWDEVWAELMKRRPDLGLQPWWAYPELRETVSNAWMSGMVPPRGCAWCTGDGFGA